MKFGEKIGLVAFIVGNGIATNAADGLMVAGISAALMGLIVFLGEW